MLIKPKLPSGTFHKKVDAYHIITHPQKPSWMVINDFGWEILKLCNGDNSIADMVRAARSRYSMPEEIIARDINQFIDSVDRSSFWTKGINTGGASCDIKSVFLHLTDKCNLLCKHCYAKNMSKPGRELTDKELVCFLEKFYAAGGRAVVLSGGEPLLRSNIKKLFNINPNAEHILLTNATIIDDEWADFLAQFNVSIQVSIDGSAAKTHDSIRGNGSFAAAMAGLAHLKRSGLQKRINLCTTIMRQNLNDLPNILELARNTGISFVRFLPLRKKGNARHNWDDIQSGVTATDYEKFFSYVLHEAIVQYPDLDIRCGLTGYILDSRKLMSDGCWCPIGKNIVIDTMGNIYPCSLFMDEQYKLGNVRENSIDDVRSNPLLSDLIMAREKRKTKTKRCCHCMWRNFCQGSCMGVVLEQHGTIWETDEFCDFRTALYEQSVIKLAREKNTLSRKNIGDTTSECY